MSELNVLAKSLAHAINNILMILYEIPDLLVDGSGLSQIEPIRASLESARTDLGTISAVLSVIGLSEENCAGLPQFSQAINETDARAFIEEILCNSALTNFQLYGAAWPVKTVFCTVDVKTLQSIVFSIIASLRERVENSSDIVCEYSLEPIDCESFYDIVLKTTVKDVPITPYNEASCIGFVGIALQNIRALSSTLNINVEVLDMRSILLRVRARSEKKSKNNIYV